MTDLSEYHRMRNEHRWTVPKYYNMATDVCDKHDPGKLAMIWTDGIHQEERVYWREIQDLSARFITFLERRGVGYGDRVGILSQPTAESTAAMIAVVKVGAIAIPMSLLWSDDSIRYRLNDADARLLLASPTSHDRNPTSAVPDIVTLDDEFLRTVYELPKSTAEANTLADDPALLYYTSGSTGQPKGILAPHRTLIARNEFEYCQDLHENELSYWMGDWAWGVYKVLGPWRIGAVNVIYDYGRKLSPDHLLATLSRLGVSNVFLNPTGLRLLMSSVPDAGQKYPQSFRVVCTSNEPLGHREAEWFEDQFGVPILETYGMTESHPLVGNFPNVPRKRGSMGLPVPGWDVQILDDEENPAPVGEPGEICLRARSNPHYPLRYWQRPEATEEDFGGNWFHTKDIAYTDNDGYFYHLGRRDDIIKSAGYRISPFEVEEACCQHPAVESAGVIGHADPTRGQIVKAFIVLNPGFAPTEDLSDEIKDFVKTAHSAFGYPKIVEFVDELPRGESGKLRRGELRTLDLEV